MKLYWCDSLTTRFVPGKCCVLFHKDYFDILETHRSMSVQGFAQVVKAQKGDPFPLFVMTNYSVVSAMLNTIPLTSSVQIQCHILKMTVSIHCFPFVIYARIMFSILLILCMDLLKGKCFYDLRVYLKRLVKQYSFH